MEEDIPLRIQSHSATHGLPSICGRCSGGYPLFWIFSLLFSTQTFQTAFKHPLIPSTLKQTTNKNTFLDYTLSSACIPITLLSLPAKVHKSYLHSLTLLPLLPFFLLPHQSRKTALAKVTMTFMLLNLTLLNFVMFTFLAAFDAVDYWPILKLFSLSPTRPHTPGLLPSLWLWLHRLLFGFLLLKLLLNIRTPHGSILGCLLFLFSTLSSQNDLYSLLIHKCIGLAKKFVRIFP